MLAQKYDAKAVEEGKYQEWLDHKYFECGDMAKKPYCIVIPPPNVTGKLHLGHAMDNTIQDLLSRYHRLKGFDVLWVPGMDHAGIATQAKVDARLKEQGVSRYDIGREKFLEKAWEWKAKYSDFIRAQWAKLGISVDYRKERFTLDEGLSKAVAEVFVKYYKEGLIYQGARVINWDPEAKTALSNIEVIHKDVEGFMYYLEYHVVDSDETFTVATTRPETMFGDVCVVVHPDDERYKSIVGRKCLLPIMNREIPIIADDFVEKEFGTGCVKITPAHDMNDYQAGLKHNLEIIEVFDENYKMGNLVPELEGMELADARKIIVDKLEQLGNLVKTEDYVHNVAKCERCKNTIEPKISMQWFVSMKDLAKKAADAVRADETRFVPKRYEKQYFNWLDNIQDWCISRQLWWGHRIPAWYKGEEIYVGLTAPEGEGWIQDNDVLDTWFSSALWPFATLGWPDENNEDLKRYFPTDCLVTGYDIIFFWVSRMMFQSEKIMGVRPFKDCVIHGLIRDKEGRKMSKSLGNGVDPFDMIDKYGCDALRYYLVTDCALGTDLRFDEVKMSATWNYINKIWNASRFVLMNIEGLKELTFDNLTEEDKWILTKYENIVKSSTKHMDKYEFNIFGAETYSFIYDDFCSNYIEFSKFNSESNTTKSVLCYVLTGILKMLHPFMPFVTEEIYGMLPIKDEESIMISEYPEYNKKNVYKEEMAAVDAKIEFIKAFRNIKTENNIPKEALVKINTDDEIIIRMLKLQDVRTTEEQNIQSYNVKAGSYEATIYYEKVLTDEEKQAKEKQIKDLENSIARRKNLLSNENYVAKAPQALVEKERETLKKEEELLETLRG